MAKPFLTGKLMESCHFHHELLRDDVRPEENQLQSCKASMADTRALECGQAAKNTGVAGTT